MKEKIFIQHVENLKYSEIEKLIGKILPERKYERVIIKPNLCFDKRILGATTSPELVKYVTEYFVKRSKEVVVVESDALLNTADEAFDNLGIREAVEEAGGKILNLSKYFPTEYKKFIFPHDLFVNLPVLKTHEFALITGAVKNMFGMIPDKKRIKYHPIIKESLVEMCKKYNNQLIIMDGIYAMEGHGPTRGNAIKMNILIGGANPAAIDTVMANIMQIPLEDVPHMRHAKKMLGVDEVDVYCDGTTLDKISRKFKRPQLDPITASKMWIWRHRIINNFLFASSFYKVTRFLGLRIRKFVRWILKMEKID